MKTIKSSFKLLQILVLILISNSFAFSQIAYDCLGGAYRANEFIVKLDDKLKPNEIAEIRDSLHAKKLGDCDCDYNLELWDVSDTYPGLSPEEKESSMGSTIEIESVDFNYLIEYEPHSETAVTTTLNPKGHSTKQVKVAILDTGVDSDHWYFTKTASRFYINKTEADGDDNVDDDGNCVVDDRSGFNYYNNFPNPVEKYIGHGSHVTGIADETSNGSLEILNLKVFGKEHEHNTLFNVTCATYYSIDRGAKVINMSFGWTGLPALCLKRAIQIAGDENCALVVCSAGNKGQNVDKYPHYPSSYGLENIMEVTALDNNYQVAPYANYGSKVDIAVQGKWTSLVPNGTAAEMEGTSMAAAAITGLAARLYTIKPTATFHEIKGGILFASLKTTSWPSGLVKDDRLFKFHPYYVKKAMSYMEGVNYAEPCKAPKENCENISVDICTFIDNNPGHGIAHKDCDNGGISNDDECKNGGDPHSPCDDCDVAMNAGLNICTLINGNLNHPLALQDCDNGGVTNYTECIKGNDPFEAKDDCVGCNNKQITNEIAETKTQFTVTPNPFIDLVSITFELEEDSPVSLRILDISGKHIYSKQVDYTSGQHSINWDGALVPSGIYILQLKTKSGLQTKRMIK